MALIKDEAGRPLAVVDLAPSGDQTTLTVSRIEQGKGELMAYYFHKGGRPVRLSVADIELTGSLSTRWQGGARIWAVKLKPFRSDESTIPENDLKAAG